MMVKTDKRDLNQATAAIARAMQGNFDLEASCRLTKHLKLECHGATLNEDTSTA